MPSFPHEALLELFRSRITLAPELLSEVFDLDPPAYSRIALSEATLTELVPTEYRADLVVLLHDTRPV